MSKNDQERRNAFQNLSSTKAKLARHERMTGPILGAPIVSALLTLSLLIGHLVQSS
ncbi:hypothetical protein KHP60_18780 [Microvirga sp. 3-52]|uniref:hypothetical protein n=1 Tax=Microvirga sp. 3-52 TaxID=2792425 RepID=UPI001AD209F8|nr:hypothetical protein [Microvirga sp. 3-52]MBO1907392.1 hypothetical protein [Microvirga sp. 3-52]MBS7454374.1 hypothetical protein [Microvirga sp. 3-52]